MLGTSKPQFVHLLLPFSFPSLLPILKVTFNFMVVELSELFYTNMFSIYARQTIYKEYLKQHLKKITKRDTRALGSVFRG